MSFYNWDFSGDTWDSNVDTWDLVTAPPPTPIPPVPGHVISFFAYDLMTNTLLAELPLTSVTWSQRLNSPGAFSASLKMSDPRVKNLDPWDATRTGRTLLVFDIDGAMQLAGIIWTRKYTESTQTLQIGGNEIESYFGQRIQARDYTTNPAETFWFGDPWPADFITKQVMVDALAVPGSAFSTMPVNLLESTGVPSANWITASYPIASLQTVDSILTTLAANGYGTGFDFGFDVSWSGAQGSTPVFALNISYPRRGRIAGSTGLTIDAAACTEYEWDEDSTAQANLVYGVASGSGGLQDPQGDVTPIAAGYPLLEQQINYTSINTESALQTATAGALAVSEWPIVTAAFTMPAFGDPAVGDFIMGDDCRVIIEPDERFPQGIDTYLRITAADYVAADEGLTTMKLTLTNLLGLAPVPPPPI